MLIKCERDMLIFLKLFSIILMQARYGFETHLRDIFSSFCLLVFKCKIIMINGFDSNKVSKSLKFCRRENRFIPFGSHVHGHFILVKISAFYMDESTLNRMLSNLYKNKHNVEVEHININVTLVW